MKSSLRILTMIHLPWSRDLGGTRTQMELAEVWKSQGHVVEKYSTEDAFPRGRGRWASELSSFSTRAISFVQKHGGNFDIIDANQMDLPVSKQVLGFQGLLVARSVGLVPVYGDFFREIQRNDPPPTTWKGWAWKGWHHYKGAKSIRDAYRSFDTADVINVSNHDDLEWMQARPNYADKAVCFPFGLTGEQASALASAAADSKQRQAAGRIVFIGSWDVRKGSRDWPDIFSRVVAARPGTRLRLLGTSQRVEEVKAAFPEKLRDLLEIIPSYRNEELPSLLADATVGAFPSYLEGFGYAVLEKLAAGLPVVAYDAPGAREMLGKESHAGTLVRAGDTAAFATKLVDYLREYNSAHFESACATAARFRWNQIADDTLRHYKGCLERLHA